MTLFYLLILMPDFEKVSIKEYNADDIYLYRSTFVNDLEETYDNKEVRMISIENDNKCITIWIEL